jgi:hypothetical protein
LDLRADNTIAVSICAIKAAQIKARSASAVIRYPFGLVGMWTIAITAGSSVMVTPTPVAIMAGVAITTTRNRNAGGEQAREECGSQADAFVIHDFLPCFAARRDTH